MTKQLTFCETSAYQIVTHGGITNGAANIFSFINTLNFFTLEPLLSAQEGIRITAVPNYSGSHIFKKNLIRIIQTLVFLSKYKIFVAFVKNLGRQR